MPLYDAFISYSHARDKPVAAALQSAIQKLGKPWYQRRALRLFRDDTSLSATPHLWPTIEQALGQSRYFLLLASPEAAASKWVNKEVTYWVEHNSIDTLLIGLTDGELSWNDSAGDFFAGETMPLPPAMAKRFPSEPKWVDLRAYRYGAHNAASKRDAKFTELAADFAAAIRGMPKEDLLSEEVRQQRRALTLAWGAVASLALITIAASILGYLAQRERSRAEQERNRALSGVQTTVGLVGGFVSDGVISTDIGKKLLEDPRKIVIDLEQERRDNSTMAVEWKLIDTLSSAYLDVPGGAKQSLDLAQQEKKIASDLASSRPSDNGFLHDSSESEVRIGDALEAKGDFDTAFKSYADAKAVMDQLIQVEPTNQDYRRDLSYIYERMGDDLYAKNDFAGAIGQYTEFLNIVQDLSRRDDAKADWIRGLALAHERMGDALRNMDQSQEALNHYLGYQQAAQRLVAKETPDSPNYKWRLDLLISYQRIGAIRLAQANYDEALKNYTIYVNGTGKLADINPGEGQWQRYLANGDIGEGDVLLAQGKVDEALADFKKASQIYTQLVAKDKFRDSWQRNLALSHERIGEAIEAKKDLAAALAEFQACVAIPVNESAIDAQVENPRMLHADCQRRADQLAAEIGKK